MQFVADVAAFAPAAKVASGLKGLARFFGLVGGGAATQIAKEGSTSALGGDQRMIDAGVRVGTAAVAAPAIEGLVKLGGMALRGGWKLATNNGAVTTTARKILDREGIDAPDEMIIAMQKLFRSGAGRRCAQSEKGGKGVQGGNRQRRRRTLSTRL